MAVGRGAGNNGPLQAARQAVANPLLVRSFGMYSGALLMVKGGTAAMTLNGVDSARQIVANALSPGASLFVGLGVDERMGEAVSLTLIATGLQRRPGDTDSQSFSPQTGRKASLTKRL